jgi:hypothetical protein
VVDYCSVKVSTVIYLQVVLRYEASVVKFTSRDNFLTNPPTQLISSGVAQNIKTSNIKHKSSNKMQPIIIFAVLASLASLASAQAISDKTDCEVLNGGFPAIPAQGKLFFQLPFTQLGCCSFKGIECNNVTETNEVERVFSLYISK